MYKDLKKVYVKSLNDITNPLDNQLYLVDETTTAYIWDGNNYKLIALNSSDGQPGNEVDPIWNKDKSNYYDKTQVDTLLVNKANVDTVYNKTQTYSKDEVDTSQTIQDNRIKALEDGGGTPIDTYTKAEIDQQQQAQDTEIAKKVNASDVYKKDEVYSKSGIDERLLLKADKTELDAKANRTDVYSKNETYSKIESDAINKIQDDRIQSLEDSSVPPTDTYTKVEIDEQQAKQDAEISKRALQSDLATKADTSSVYTKQESDTKLSTKANIADVYQKSETYSKAEVDAMQKDETDPIWNVEKSNYRKVADQDFIDNELNKEIEQIKTDVDSLVSRESFTPIAIALTKLIDNVTSNTNNLTFEVAPKFYTNNKVFSNNAGVVTNNDTFNKDNNIIIEGDIQLIMAGLLSALTTVTISCADDINGVKKQRQFTVSTESSFAIPFRFVIPGDKNSTNITVTFSGLSGLSSRKIMPTYVTFTKLK